MCYTVFAIEIKFKERFYEEERLCKARRVEE